MTKPAHRILQRLDPWIATAFAPGQLKATADDRRRRLRRAVRPAGRRLPRRTGQHQPQIVMIWLAGGLVLLALGTTVAVLRRRYIVVRVRGTSMTPTLRDGDRVLVHRVRLERVRPGDMVVVATPAHARGDPLWLVKRAAAVPGNPVPTDRFPILPATDAAAPPDRLVLLSDNPAASYDSRRIGYLAGDTLLGVVVRTLVAGRGEEPVDLQPASLSDLCRRRPDDEHGAVQFWCVEALKGRLVLCPVRDVGTCAGLDSRR